MLAPFDSAQGDIHLLNEILEVNKWWLRLSKPLYKFRHFVSSSDKLLPGMANLIFRFHGILSPFFNQLLHISRYLAVKKYRLFGNGMRNTQCFGMQGVAR